MSDIVGKPIFDGLLTGDGVLLNAGDTYFRISCEKDFSNYTIKECTVYPTHVYCMDWTHFRFSTEKAANEYISKQASINTSSLENALYPHFSDDIISKIMDIVYGRIESEK